MKFRVIGTLNGQPFDREIDSANAASARKYAAANGVAVSSVSLVRPAGGPSSMPYLFLVVSLIVLLPLTLMLAIMALGAMVNWFDPYAKIEYDAASISVFLSCAAIFLMQVVTASLIVLAGNRICEAIKTR